VALDGSGDYTRIQLAIQASKTGDIIVVRPGIYVENVQFLGKNIFLRSENPEDWSVVEQTIIKAAASQPVVTFSGNETSACRLEGFTIQDGFAPYGGGVLGQSTYAVIRRCIIRNNTALNAGGGLQSCNGLVESCRITGNTSAYGGAAAGCHGVIINCIVSDNQATEGALAFNNCDGIIAQCTVAGNTGSGPAVLFNCDGQIDSCIFWDNQAITFLNSSSPVNSCFPDADGTAGNIYFDPQFLFPGDYRLRSGSPCIDAGSVNPPVELPETDILGQVRLMDGTGMGQPIADMGACEFDPSGPLIAASHPYVVFTAVDGQPAVQQKNLWIANAGGGTFDWTISDLPTWLAAAPETGRAAAGQEPNLLTLTADIEGLAPGRYSYALYPYAPDALNWPYLIQIELVVVSLDAILVPQNYLTIQEAIDAAGDGSRIIVADGVYTGPFNKNLDFCGKKIILESANGPDRCIIDCQQSGRGFYFHNGEDENAVVKGFTIRNGAVEFGFNNTPEFQNLGGGGMLIINSSPLIINCRFSQNKCYGVFQNLGGGGGLSLSNSRAKIIGCTFSENSAYNGGALYLYAVPELDGGPIIKNCIICGNTAFSGAGIYGLTRVGTAEVSFCTIVENQNSGFSVGAGVSGGRIEIKNSILWANGNGSEVAQISSPGAGYITVSYSCVQGLSGQLGGDGNIGLVPKFVKPGYWLEDQLPVVVPLQPTTLATWVEGDYHLKSEGWRWDFTAGRWTFDKATSPCIDAGNPADELGKEPAVIPIDPAGIFGKNLRVDMGAYGQTDQASLAPPDQILLTDMTNDGTTDLNDLLILASRWFRQDYHPFYKARGADFTRDNMINLADLACLAGEWLQKKVVKRPVGHWTFDQNWLDTTGRIEGIPFGGALISHSFYKIGGGAAYFDGIDDKVIMQGFKGVCGQNDRTVCFWMNTTDVNQTLLGWGSFQEYGKWEIMTEQSGRIILRLQMGSIYGGPSVNDGQWHHVAVVLNVDGASADTRDILLYIDGLPILQKAGVHSPIDTDEFYDLSVGCFKEVGCYKGFLDDLRIYDTALIPWQIADIFYGEE